MRLAKSALNRLSIALVLVVASCVGGCGGASDSQTPAKEPNPAEVVPSTTAPSLPAPRESLLVDRDQLEALLDQEYTVVLDARTEDDYAEAHVPGAIRVDSNVWRTKAHEDGGLADAGFWATAIGDLGIDNDSQVVVYGGRTPTNAARVWWHLKYAGVAKALLLDGGWELWKSGGKPTATEVHQPHPAKFEPNLQTDRIATKTQIAEALAEGKQAVVVLDARSIDEYQGKVRGQRGGHIPGAKHLEWKQLLDVNGRFKSDDELAALFEDLGIRPDQAVITHCQSGGRSSVEVFALELAGFSDVRNYYRGWSEWSADEEVPVEK